MHASTIAAPRCILLVDRHNHAHGGKAAVCASRRGVLIRKPLTTKCESKFERATLHLKNARLQFESTPPAVSRFERQDPRV
eukprot:4036872-Pyramimonas_sp.AAC.1